jgi:hypothetical protein
MSQMFTVEECRERAQQCAEAAPCAANSDRNELLRLANDWLILSDLIAKRFPATSRPAH